MVGFFVSPSLARGACVQLVFIAEELRGLGRGPCFVEKKPSFFTPIAVAGIFDFFLVPSHVLSALRTTQCWWCSRDLACFTSALRVDPPRRFGVDTVNPQSGARGGRALRFKPGARSERFCLRSTAFAFRSLGCRARHGMCPFGMHRSPGRTGRTAVARGMACPRTRRRPC